MPVAPWDGIYEIFPAVSFPDSQGCPDAAVMRGRRASDIAAPRSSVMDWQGVAAWDFAGPRRGELLFQDQAEQVFTTAAPERAALDGRDLALGTRGASGRENCGRIPGPPGCGRFEASAMGLHLPGEQAPHWISRGAGIFSAGLRPLSWPQGRPVPCETAEALSVQFSAFVLDSREPSGVSPGNQS